MKVSLDDGITWVDTDSVRICKLSERVDSNGENIDSELHFNFTHEGLTKDLWIDNVCERTISDMYEDIGDMLACN